MMTVSWPSDYKAPENLLKCGEAQYAYDEGTLRNGDRSKFEFTSQGDYDEL